MSNLSILTKSFASDHVISATDGAILKAAVGPYLDAGEKQEIDALMARTDVTIAPEARNFLLQALAKPSAEAHVAKAAKTGAKIGTGLGTVGGVLFAVEANWLLAALSGGASVAFIGPQIGYAAAGGGLAGAAWGAGIGAADRPLASVLSYFTR